jgi:two-component system sensor histidine kinase YesM
MRFGDSFSYTIENHVQGNYYVLKLILQPIVENSLVHGFGEHPERDAKIHVEAKEEGDNLVFVLEDNGFGILPEKVNIGLLHRGPEKASEHRLFPDLPKWNIAKLF